MPELPSDQDDLPAMVRFMGHEVRGGVSVWVNATKDGRSPGHAEVWVP